MGSFCNNKYIDIWLKMPENEYVTAASLKVAPASMTAMVRRKLVEDRNTSPKTYKKLPNKLANILIILQKEPREFFTIYRENEKLGMLCSLDKEEVMNCWGKPYNVDNAIKIELGNKSYNL